MKFLDHAQWLAGRIRRFPDLVVMYAAAAAGMLRRRTSFVVESHTGARSLKGAAKVAVFAHYDGCGRVHDYVIYYLGALRRAGFEIVFATSAPKLDDGYLARIAPYCALILRRKNVGYDFGTYKDALASLGNLSLFDEVLLANDSVYGPLFDLNSILLRCDDSADVWGMTDSQERSYHLQSYFLVLKRAALTSRHMIAFWQAVKPVQSRAWVIRRYEIGLTRAASLGGLRCAALFPYRVAGQGSSVLNVMHHRWQEIIRAGCPFIKRELLAKNPWNLSDIADWKCTIQTMSKYDTNLIERHLKVWSDSQHMQPHRPAASDADRAMPEARQPMDASCRM